MIDVLITTYNRVSFLRQTVETFMQKNSELPYRLFIIDDCSEDGTDQYLLGLKKKGIADIFLSRERRGVVFGFDLLWSLSDLFGFFFSENDYVCYLQDDLVSVENNWMLKIIGVYERLREKYKIGFFSGFDAPEHPVKEVFGWDGHLVLIKKSTSATNLIAEKSFLQTIGYLPRLNRDGSRRGFPDKGVGSHIDVDLIGCYSKSKFHPTHSAPNCSYRQGKDVMVIPGCLQHLGQPPKESTWR